MKGADFLAEPVRMEIKLRAYHASHQLNSPMTISVYNVRDLAKHVSLILHNSVKLVKVLTHTLQMQRRNVSDAQTLNVDIVTLIIKMNAMSVDKDLHCRMLENVRVVLIFVQIVTSQEIVQHAMSVNLDMH